MLEKISKLRLKGVAVIVVFSTAIVFILGSFVISCSEKNEISNNPDTVRFFAFGDWGRDGIPVQRATADVMETYATLKKVDFILSLGDNFYPYGLDSVNDPQIQTSFEDIYLGSLTKIPWYVALGNHDYMKDPKAEIGYTKRSGRWNMPYYFYTKKISKKHTSIRLVVLDTNPFERTYYTIPRIYQNFKIDTIRQKIWMDSVFSLNDADWVIVAGHHPVYTGGARAKNYNSVNKALIPIFSKFNLPIYLAGHEHDLQHLKAEGVSINQFVSGAGSELGPKGTIDITKFSASIQGFMSIEASKSTVDFYVIDYKQDTLYRTQILK